MVATAISASLSFSTSSLNKTSVSFLSSRNSTRSIVSALPSPYGDSSTVGLSSRTRGLPLKIDEKNFRSIEPRFVARTLLLAVLQIYLNCPGGSTYSVLAIYDCMSWVRFQKENNVVSGNPLVWNDPLSYMLSAQIKPKVGTVCFGVAASQGALLLAGGEKGMRYAMPNARVMIHQPLSGCGGQVEDVRRQVNEAVQSRHKLDRMYAAFTGQTLEKVQQFTERDRFLSVSEAMEFGLIDGILETEY
ncbi:hypothetical protein JRO89_XS02G0049100 [Xanthoceras sorbifolium]|uniref:ATP-dependent Clp protease proteolytic subunit n=1 Tax=Xanthoceras sorbifolium TaxID=99658 RepID=A0ABQ8IF31_9ROSI|nr:hypothetical protein JRO89_XS02G0049100 [Xanthoceras sorbifolium]